MIIDYEHDYQYHHDIHYTYFGAHKITPSFEVDCIVAFNFYSIYKFYIK